jgi:Abnormal spindle-like microcephaly-assoc'd, ASPM-SPD-2-Hydin/Protein of unknown function (DUF1573)
MKTDSPKYAAIRRAVRGPSTLAIGLLFVGVVCQIGCTGVTAAPGTDTGGATPTISLNPPSVSFGSVVVGTSASQNIIVSNSGTASLTVTEATLSGAQFSLTGVSLPMTIGAGQQATVTIGFSPTSAGNASGSISITSNASSTPLTVSLSGTGVAATHLLGASTTSLNFGNVDDGTPSSQNVTLTNNGNSSVTISGVTTAGAGFSGGGVSAGTILTANQTATLTVTFDPSSPGAASGTVTVASNATNSPISVSVSGTGVQSSSSSVLLSWTASTSSGVVGYNVYRGTTSGSYSEISSSVSGTTYTDTTVQSGQNITYYYVVTAVNSSGEESTDSNQASVTVP